MAGLCLCCKGSRIEAEDQMSTCIVLEGSLCLPCKERAAICHQIKQLEEEIIKLKAKHDTFGTAINAIHNPFTFKFPPEIASHIL